MFSMFQYDSNAFIIAEVFFNINFKGTMDEYPNYLNFLEIDFNDSETLTRDLAFQVSEEDEGIYVALESHKYKSYGTYYPRVVLTNNVSRLELNLRVEVEQCVSGFKIGITSERYLLEKRVVSL